MFFKYSKSVLWASALLLMAASCGRKGNPVPPPSLAPAAVHDLQASQQGPEIVLRFSYPSVTESGLPITEVQGINILRFDQEAPELLESAALDSGELTEETLEAAGEEESASEIEPAEDDAAATLESAENDLDGEEVIELPGVDQRMFESFAGTIKEYGQSDVGRLIDGDQIVIRMRDEALPQDPWIYSYAVVVKANDRNSATSNITSVHPIAPPESIVSLRAEATAEGIRISWDLLADESVTGYKIYRRGAENPQFGAPFQAVAASEAPSLLDTTAEMGQRWVYAVTAVGPRGVESAWGSQREVFYRDVFPPDAPTALVAIPDSTGIRLLWRHQPPSDHDGYAVIRSQGGLSQTLNETLVSSLEFTDQTASSGQQYSYQVTAVDRSGNASDPSELVDVLAP